MLAILLIRLINVPPDHACIVEENEVKCFKLSVARGWRGVREKSNFLSTMLGSNKKRKYCQLFYLIFPLR